MPDTRSRHLPVPLIGDPDRSAPPYDLIVVGAGIAGLAAGLTALTTAGGSSRPRVLLLDAHPAGGRARTNEHNGFLHNIGPHALYRTGALAALLDHHDIAVSGGTPASVGARAVRNGTAHLLPTRPVELLRTRLLSRSDRLRLIALLARIQRTDPARLVGRPVAELTRDTGGRVREFLEMFVRVSTYTDAPQILDAGAAVAQMQMALGPGVRYLDGGWGSMVTSMVDAFEALGGELHTSVEVRAVSTAGTTGAALAPGATDAADGRSLVTVTTATGTLVSRGVVVAAGGPEVAERLTGAVVHGLDRVTPPVTASVVDLALRDGRPALAFALDAPLYLSAHAPSARLAPSGCGLVSIMRYHAPGADAGDASLRRAELRAFAGTVGITPDDVVHERYMHRLVVTHGSPTAAGGGLAGRPTVDALDLAGVYLAGDWVGDVGLLADASAASGATAARTALRSCASIAA